MAKRTSKAQSIDAFHYADLAYRDYVAARHLLLHEHLFAGATLASTAVEKYVKCAVATRGERFDLHLDRLSEFRTFVNRRGITLLEEVDPRLLTTLSNAYRLRYYDHDSEMHTFGFLKWQLLAELDAFVSLVESRLSFGADPTARTPYRVAVEAATPLVWKENWLLAATDKKAFMERVGTGLLFTAREDGSTLSTLIGPIGVERYEGRMQTIVSANFSKADLAPQ